MAQPAVLVAQAVMRQRRLTLTAFRSPFILGTITMLIQGWQVRVSMVPSGVMGEQYMFKVNYLFRGAFSGVTVQEQADLVATEVMVVLVHLVAKNATMDG